jgi:hypothetical protein
MLNAYVISKVLQKYLYTNITIAYYFKIYFLYIPKYQIQYFNVVTKCVPSGAKCISAV